MSFIYFFCLISLISYSVKTMLKESGENKPFCGYMMLMIISVSKLFYIEFLKKIVSDKYKYQVTAWISRFRIQQLERLLPDWCLSKGVPGLLLHVWSRDCLQTGRSRAQSSRRRWHTHMSRFLLHWCLRLKFCKFEHWCQEEKMERDFTSVTQLMWECALYNLIIDWVPRAEVPRGLQHRHYGARNLKMLI